MWHLGRSQNPELAQTSSTLMQGRGVDWKDRAGPFLFVFPFFFFWLSHVACGISVPWPGIEPTPSAVESQNLNHWAAREVPPFLFPNAGFPRNSRYLSRDRNNSSTSPDMSQPTRFVFRPSQEVFLLVRSLQHVHKVLPRRGQPSPEMCPLGMCRGTAAAVRKQFWER